MRAATHSRVPGRPSPVSRRVARSLRVRAAEKAEARPETEQERKDRFKQTFSTPKSHEGAVAILASIPTPVFYAAAAVLAGAAGCAGYVGGSKLPVRVPQPATAYGAAVVGAGVVVGAASNAKTARQAGAGVDIWNSLVESDDPTSISPDAVKAISSKYGVDLSSTQLLEVKQAYSAYLQSMIPPGDQPLRGDEALKLRQFLSTLGLPDEAAAECHLDVGRSFYRMRLENKASDATAAGTRPFQKVVYVSTALFGERQAAFLIPWTKRCDGVTPEHLAIARRDCSRAIMKGRIASEFGGKIPATLPELQRMRAAQLDIGLPDETCDALVREVIAADVDQRLTAAVAVVKRRGASSENAPAVTALDELLELSARYAAVAKTTNAVAGGDAKPELAVVPGLGPITTAGTSFATENKNDLLDLYKLYVETKMREAGDALTAPIAARLDALVSILGVTPARAATIKQQIVEATYYKLLQGAVQSGQLDAAASPATVLNQLLTQAGMPGEQAAALHESLYRKKLEEVVADGVVSDEDARALERTSRLLCLQPERVTAMDKEVKGRLLRDAIQKALDVGYDAFGKYEREQVLSVKDALRFDDASAFQVLQELGRRMMAKMINGARLKSSKLENARALREVVYFSNVILAPLVAAFKQAPASPEEAKADAMKEVMEVLAKAKAEAAAEEAAEAAEVVDSPSEAVEGAQPTFEASEAGEDAAAQPAAAAAADAEPSTSAVQPTSLAKAEKAATARAGGETLTTESGKEVAMGSQKEITVADDFERRERVEIYKTYLMFCMTGDVVQLPMGGTIVMERDETEFARLSQLGDILGLTQMDVYEVHSGMAEQAYKSQAEEIIGGSTVLNAEGRERLDEMAKKFGLPDETAKRIVRGISNRRMAGNLSSMKAQGLLTLGKVLELKNMDVDVSSVLSENDLLQLYREEVERQVASGQGAIDAERTLVGLPAELGVDGAKARKIGQEIAKSKARNILVQAVAYFRQKKPQDALKYLKNFLACTRLNGGDMKGAGQWGRAAELLDLYGEFCTATESDELKLEMAAALELGATESANVREAVAAGTFGKASAAGASKSEANRSIF